MELIWEGERWGGGQVKVDTIYGQMDESYTYKQDWARAFRYRQCLLRLREKEQQKAYQSETQEDLAEEKEDGKEVEER